jgi:hypothetical protein
MQFIEPLREFFVDVLREYDRKFLERIVREFACIPHQVNLTDIHIKWLIQIFAERWAIVMDSNNDYTVRVDQENRYWIGLADDLAKEVKLHQVQILMPTILSDLSKIGEGESLIEYYRSDDGVSLSSLRGIIDIFSRLGVFATYNDKIKGSFRALTLPELSRLRLKEGSFSVVGSNVHPRFWDYLTSNISLKCTDKGELPQYLLRPLLQLVKLYFDEKRENPDKKQFAMQFIIWSNCLKECSEYDLNYLYAQQIPNVSGRWLLLDALLDVYQGLRADLDVTMIGIARWLCMHDVSLIVECQELDETYAKLGLGRAFDLVALKRLLQDELLPTCGEDKNDNVREGVLISIKRLVNHTVIDEKIVSRIREVYRRRWLKICGTPIDYTRLQDGVNLSWIKLARLLSGAGLIDTTYYHLLMPTIQQGSIDPITRDLYTTYPLSHYLLSDDATEIILLDHSLRQLNELKYFCNCSASQPKPFTRKEISNIQYANSIFHQYKDLAVQELYDAPISKNTVLALKKLVEESVYPEGLLFLHKYDDAQEVSSQRAYSQFYSFLKQLSPCERKRLDDQNILYHGRNITFSEVMRNIERIGEDGLGECIAVNGQYIAQLVMDYAPYELFNERLEQRVDINHMRSVSRKKVFNEYESLTEVDAKRRIQILAVSLMTHSFQFPGIGSSVSIWDCSNTMVHNSQEIASLIIPLLRAEDSPDSRYIFATIIESIVKPALEKKDQSWVSWMMRYQDTNQWLRAIVDGSLFMSKSAWFEPFVLMERLSLAIDSMDHNLRPQLKEFLDSLIQTYAQSERASLKEIRVNIKFALLLQKLGKKEGKRVIDLLGLDPTKGEKPSFSRLCSDYLINRLIEIGVSASKPPTQGFFATYSSCNPRQLRSIFLEFSEKKMKEHSSLSPQLFMRIKDRISHMSDSIGNRKVKLAMIKYLDSITAQLATFSHRSKMLSKASATPAEELPLPRALI